MTSTSTEDLVRKVVDAARVFLTSVERAQQDYAAWLKKNHRPNDVWDIPDPFDGQEELAEALMAVGAVSTLFTPPPATVEKSEKNNSCNRHDDCIAANAKWLAAHPRELYVPANFHCHDADCEDCFGK